MTRDTRVHALPVGDIEHHHTLVSQAKDEKYSPRLQYTTVVTTLQLATALLPGVLSVSNATNAGHNYSILLQLNYAWSVSSICCMVRIYRSVCVLKKRERVPVSSRLESKI